ncbi:MAG: TldD/PmbA family protein [Candidatus Methylomirabilia bacterium]
MKREIEVLGEVLRQARAGGAGRAEAFHEAGTGRSVEYSDKGLESYRGSDAAGLGLRVFVGRKAGFADGQDFTAVGLERLAARAVESAKIAELPAFPTPCGGALRDDLKIFDTQGLAATVADDRAQLERVIGQARATDPAVRRIKSVSLRSGQRETTVLSSTGTRTTYTRSSFSLVAGVVAERDGQSELGWESDVATSRGALPWGSIGALAAAKAVSRLGAGRPAGGRQPVILDREVVAEFLSLLGSTFSADAVLKGRSPLAGKIGAAVAAGTVTVVHAPTLPGAAGSAPCDDEGQPTRRKVLIDAGVLTGYLHSLETAHKMGVDPTGNGFRGSFESLPLPRSGNLVLQPGLQAPDAWTRAPGTIVLVDDILGAHTMNPVSGDFSVGASGFIFERGLRRPFRGATIAGNLGALFASIAEVGDDLRFFGSVAAPSVLVSALDLSA